MEASDYRTSVPSRLTLGEFARLRGDRCVRCTGFAPGSKPTKRATNCRRNCAPGPEQSPCPQQQALRPGSTAVTWRQARQSEGSPSREPIRLAAGIMHDRVFEMHPAYFERTRRQRHKSHARAYSINLKSSKQERFLPSRQGRSGLPGNGHQYKLARKTYRWQEIRHYPLLRSWLMRIHKLDLLESIQVESYLDKCQRFYTPTLQRSDPNSQLSKPILSAMEREKPGQGTGQAAIEPARRPVRTQLPQRLRRRSAAVLSTHCVRPAL